MSAARSKVTQPGASAPRPKSGGSFSSPAAGRSFAEGLALHSPRAGSDPLQKKPSGGGAGSAAEEPQEYTCTLGGAAFDVTVDAGKPKKASLRGFKRTFGDLRIDKLSGTLSQGDRGPKGTVQGTATLLKKGKCNVSGRFQGSRLVLDVTFDGALTLARGMKVTNATMRVDGELTGSGEASLELLDATGSTVADVHVGAGGVLSAEARNVPIDTADGVVGGAVDVLYDKRSGIEVTSAGLWATTPWGARAELEDLELRKGRLQGKARVPLDGIPGMTFDGDSTVELMVGAGRCTGKVGPLGWTSTVNPAMSGDLKLTFDSSKGASGRAGATVQHGASQTKLAFDDVEYVAGQGLTGVAKVATEHLGIDWTAAPFVRSLSGEATVRLERGGLVTGGGVAKAGFTFGDVAIALDDIGTTGPSATLTATVTSLGPNVILAAPLVIQGTHAGGVTKFTSEGATFSVVTADDHTMLNGVLGKTAFDEAGLMTSLDLDLFAGPLGEAVAHADVVGGDLQKASFAFVNPVFVYPAGKPILTGTFGQADIAYDKGRFTGGVAGTAELAIEGAEGEAGAMHFSGNANTKDGFDMRVEGQNLTTSLLTVDTFFLEIKDGAISSDVQATGSPDLPFDVTGSVSGSFNETGLALAGGLDLSTKQGSVPDLDGHVDVGYSSEKGLWANGQGSAIIDKERNFVVQAAIAYGDGSLWVSAHARGLWEAKSPLVDVAGVMGPKVDKLSGKVTIPVAGVPYVHGMTAELKTKAGLKIGTDISGVSVDAGMPAWDALGDKPPKIDVGVQWKGRPVELGLGLQMAGQINGHFVAATVGVEVMGKAGFDLATKDPTFRAVGSWDENGDVIGDLFVDLPMVLQMSPEMRFRVMAGGAKWTMGVPGTKETWKPEPITLKELDPLHFEWRLEDLLRDETKQSEPGMYGLGDLTQPKGLDTRRDPIIKGFIDHNPKLKKVVDAILGSVQLFDYSLEEGEAFYEWNSELLARMAGGDSLESAQRESEFLEKILREQKTIARNIPRYTENIRARADQAGHSGKLGGLKKAVQDLYHALNTFVINCQTLEGHFGQPIDKVFELQIKVARGQVNEHLMALKVAIAKGAG